MAGSHPRSAEIGLLDGLVTRVLQTYPYRFTVAVTAADRRTAFRIRHAAVVTSGWADGRDFPDGLECDEFDDVATQVVGWDSDQAICTGRLVFPPHALPTERAAGIAVEPRGAVADVGRMTVVPAYQTYRHAAFIALLCRLYLEMRDAEIEVACGMMSPRLRTLVRHLGLRVEVLGPDRTYWGEDRAPVRFALTANALPTDGPWLQPPDAVTPPP